MMKEFETEYLYLDDCLNHLSARKRKIDSEMVKIKANMETLEEKIINAYTEDGVCPEGLTVAKIAPNPIITDESLLPERFIKVTKTVNKSAVNKAIKNGESIDGVSMGNGGITIKIKQQGV